MQLRVDFELRSSIARSPEICDPPPPELQYVLGSVCYLDSPCFAPMDESGVALTISYRFYITIVTSVGA